MPTNTNAVSNNNAVKQQRDQFLAFAFASADLFFEVSSEGRIVFALGASKGLTGIDHKTLNGINWLELFTPLEQTVVNTTMESAKMGLRQGPMVVKLAEKYTGRKAILTGIKMPHSASYFITLGFTNVLIEDIADKTDDTNTRNILRRQDFINGAQHIIRSFIDDGTATYISFIFVEDYIKNISSLGPGSLKLAIDALDEVCLSNSINGTNAGKLSDDVYALVHNEAVKADALEAELTKKLKEVLKDDLTTDFKISTVKSDLQSLDKSKTINAITRSIDDFMHNNTLSYDTLSGALDAYNNEIPNKVKTFESYIERVSFSFNFQQIVDTSKPNVDHFETMCVFEDGHHAISWISFAEQHGLIAAFDLSVLERTINLIKFKDGMTNKKYAMNMSALSLNDPEFIESFILQLQQNEDINARLIIELNSTHNLTDISQVEHFIDSVSDLKFPLILDDTHPNNLILNSSKIEKFKFVKFSAAIGNKAIKEIKQICDQHTNIKMIAKAVESEKRFNELSALGISLMQGYYFGKPSPKAQLDNAL